MTVLTSSRRDALAFGGATIFLASMGGMLRAADPVGRPLPEGDAYAPWRLWNDPSIAGTPLALVAAGVLAANPHDTQPWLFGVSANGIEIFADLSRNLGAMDVYVREMHLGLGCAIENMRLAAGPNGYAVEVEATPGSLTALDEREAPVHAATLRLTRRERTAPDSLYRAIPNRHTNRYAYDRDRALPEDWRRFASHADAGDDVRVFLFEDGEPRRLFDAAVVEATQAIIADKTMIADSDRWFRNSSAEIDAHRDGPTLDAAGLSSLTLLFARLFPVSPETSHKAWLDQTRDVQLASARVAGLIAVRDRYDRVSAIAAGRRLATPAFERHGAGRGDAAAQPTRRDDRPREASRAWPELGGALGASDGRRLAGDVFIPRRLRAGNGARESPPTPEGCAETVATCDYVMDEDPVSGRPDARR